MKKEFYTMLRKDLNQAITENNIYEIDAKSLINEEYFIFDKK